MFLRCTGITLWMHPANEKRRYVVMSSLIRWAHTQNKPCYDVITNILILLVSGKLLYRLEFPVADRGYHRVHHLHRLCRHVLQRPLWKISASGMYQQDVNHYSDVMMSAIVSQITGVSIVYLTVCPGAFYRKHQSSASIAFVRGTGDRWIPRKKGPVTWKVFDSNKPIVPMRNVAIIV